MLSSKINIVMIQDFFGVNLAYQENLLSEYYVKMGYSVTIICSTYENVKDYIANKYDASKPKKIAWHNEVKVIRLPYTVNFLNKIKVYSGLYDILMLEKPDLIYIHDISFNMMDVAKYVRLHKSKVIMDFHADAKNSATTWVSKNILHKIIRKSFLNHYLKYFDKLYAVSPSCLDFVVDVYGVKLNDISLLPLGCDYEKNLKVMKEVDKTVLRKKLGINLDDFVIITGGKFNPHKKTELVIDAVLSLNNPKIHVLVFGSPEYGYDEYANNLECKMKQSGNIHALGFLSSLEMMEAMAISDVAVFPSSQSVVWQQAIGMHLPLIIGGEKYSHLQYLNQNNNVIILGENVVDACSISNSISTLVMDPEILNDMKLGAEKTAREFLDYKIIAEKTLEVLE